MRIQNCINCKPDVHFNSIGTFYCMHCRSFIKIDFRESQSRKLILVRKVLLIVSGLLVLISLGIVKLYYLESKWALASVILGTIIFLGMQYSFTHKNNGKLINSSEVKDSVVTLLDLENTYQTKIYWLGFTTVLAALVIFLSYMVNHFFIAFLSIVLFLYYYFFRDVFLLKKEIKTRRMQNKI